MSDSFERFTDRARTAMNLAPRFALEQHSPFVEPEHLLRALGSIDRGVGRAVLESLGVDLLNLLPRIVELLPPMPGGFRYDQVFSPRMDSLLVAAWQAATELNHPYVGTEHLTLALLRVPGPTADFLTVHGVTYGAVTASVRHLLGQDDCYSA